MFSDIRFAFRSLLKSPGFTIVAVLMLALGIGANTAIFSAFNTILLRSLPVPDPQDLRTLAWSTNDAEGGPIVLGSGARKDGARTVWGEFSYPTYETFRDHASGFDSVFAFGPIFGATLRTGTSLPASEDGLYVSGNFFEGYGGRTLIGRLLTPRDDRPGAPPVALITYDLWAELFALDPRVLNRTVVINNISLEVVGVLPRAFRGPTAGDPARFYVPMAISTLLRSFPTMLDPKLWSVQVMGRRDQRVHESRAQSSLDMLFVQSAQTLGYPPKPDVKREIRLEEGQHGSVGANMMQEAIAEPIYVLAAAAGALLILMCANLASLMLARAFGRERELAVRAALGAGRWRLLCQPLAEAFILATAGCVLGTLLAIWFAGVAEALLPRVLPQFPATAFRIALDGNVLGFAISIAFLTALLCGLFAAVHASRTDPLPGMRSTTVTPHRQRLARTLVCLQVALSVLLLVGAGLLVRTFANLMRVAPGFEAQNVLLFEVAPAQSNDESDIGAIRFFDETRRAVAAIPGVQAVSHSNIPMVAGGRWTSQVVVREAGSQQREVPTSILMIADSFLSTLHIPLLSGREFTNLDSAQSERVAIANAEFARSYLKSRNPVGAMLDMDGQSLRIVGLARDSLFVGIKDKKLPLLYLPFRQHPAESFMPTRMTFAVRSMLPAASLGPALRNSVAAVDSRVAVAQIRTQIDQIGTQMSTERTLAAFSGCIAVLATVLSGFGLFGLLAYSVARRTNEIGVRMALGARQTDVMQMVLRQGMKLVVAGLIIGIVGALGLTRLLQSFLWGVETTDPLTIITAVLLLSLIAVGACMVPARRASRVDPLVALRAE